MDFGGDERGQSIQIGAILLFAVLIVSFSSYQAFVVPEQNRGIEFNHNQDVQSQLQDLRNAIVSATGSDEAVSVALGTRYPSRAVARNPGPPSGSLRTVGTTDETVALTISNAQASGETGDFWNQTRSYNTGAIAYQPGYNRYTTAPRTVYDTTTLYNEFPSGTIVIANQSFIDGTELSLVVLNGSLSRTAAGSTSVDVRSVSTSTRQVRLEDDGSPITITFTSIRSGAYWQFLESTQSTVTDVSGTSRGDGRFDVAVTLDDSRTYELRLTKVGVGTGVTNEDAAYLTAIGDAERTVTRGQRVELPLEVRDRFNNPPANGSEMTVEASLDGSGALEETTQTPDADGRVTFVYAATGSTGEQTIDVSYVGVDGSFDASTPQNVSITVDVQSDGSSSTSSSETTLFADGFENDPFGSDWETFDESPPASEFTAATTTDAVNEGSTAVELTNADNAGIQMTSGAAVDTSDADAVQIAAWAQEGLDTSGPEASDDEDLVVEYYNADGEWDTVERLPADDDVVEREYNPRIELTGDDALHSAFRIRFRQLAAGGTDPWFIDDVAIGTTGSGGSTNGGGGSPSIDTADGYPGNGNKYSVDYAVSDSDGDLSNVSVILEDGAGTNIDVVEVLAPSDPETGSVAGTTTVSYSGSDSPAQVRIIARDASGVETSSVDTDLQNQN